MIPSVVQSASGATTANTQTSCAAVLNNVTVGNLLVACFNGGVSALTSVSDGTNSYVKAVADINFSATEIWYAKNVAAGSFTITANQSGAEAGTIIVYEIVGLDRISPLDTTTVNHGDGATTNTPTITTGSLQSAGELLIATTGMFTGSGTDIATAGVGFTNLVTANSTPTTGQTISGGAEVQPAVGSGAQTATFGLAFGTTTWEIVAATFLSASINKPENTQRYFATQNGMSRGSETAN